MTTDTVQWRALGTYVQLAGAPALLTAGRRRAEEILEAVDAACSRFRDDSDLNRVNANPGVDQPISTVLWGALTVALQAADETDGLLDPTLGAQLAASGYSVTFAQVPQHSADPVHLPVRTGDWRSVVLGPRIARVPRGCRLDLGATGKAYAADLVAEVLAAELGGAWAVSLGGDVRIGGSAAGAPFGVAIGQQPDDAAAADAPVVALTEGGLATSSRAARSWQRAGRRWHHLIDPRTGLPADGPWRTVTAWGKSAVAANTASATALILGADALPWLEGRSVAARLIDDDGRITRTTGWVEAFGEVA